MKKDIRIAVLGLGWMGQAHSRSALRIPSLFPGRGFQPILQVCADEIQRDRRARLTIMDLRALLVIGWRQQLHQMLTRFG
jgi:hypothetical protein